MEAKVCLFLRVLERIIYKILFYVFIMKLKQIPEDFVVKEIYDLDKLRKKQSIGEEVYYFILKKKNYTLNRAMENISKIFLISQKNVHFAGMKDRQGVTTQLISIINAANIEENVEKFNPNYNGLNLEKIGKFPARLNLGDNIGNEFRIVIRDLEEKEIVNAKKRIKEISDEGIPNYFDSQRFGFGDKNPVIGKYLIRGDFKKAFFHILTAIPEENQKKEHREFVDYIEENWEKIVYENRWKEVLDKIPFWLKEEINMINYVRKYENNFLGAINLLHKKIRTMYVNSYQSYLFNETIKYLISIGKFKEYSELPLVSFRTKLAGDWGKYVQQLMSQDGINLESFKMLKSPTIRPKEIIRQTRIQINSFKILSEDKDELNLGKTKMILSFGLDKGSYATNVVKEIFN